MRTAFETWAQRDGQIVRRREDKPDEYLMFETQRRWVIWQAALTYEKPDKMQDTSNQAALRNRVLDEVLDACMDLDDTAGIEGIAKAIRSLRQLADSTNEI